MNVANRTMFIGDNLPVLRRIDTDSIDLIYLDPPFNSNRDYSAPVGSKEAEAAFKDAWTLDDLDEREMAELSMDVYAICRASQIAHGNSMFSYIAMMAPRLTEMKRVLKENGSIYLHCDDTADAYLRILMDTIFGSEKLQNVITWKRSRGAKNNAKKYHRDSDRILFYRGKGATWNTLTVPLSKEVADSWYRYTDDDGRRYNVADLSAPGNNGHYYEFLGAVRGWRHPEEKMQQLLREGRIIHRSITPGSHRKVAGYKRYLDESKGAPIGTIWADINPIGRSDKESTNYPTQKPLALLRRIISASSKPGDMVLDPFCGCATACVAAEQDGRHWIGIDLSDVAVDLVIERLKNDVYGSLNFDAKKEVTARRSLPRRSDAANLPRTQTYKSSMYGEQEGYCKGCGKHFEIDNITIDHIIPVSRGGDNRRDNLQLLCGNCNSSKGDKPMAYLNRKNEVRIQSREYVLF